MTTRAPGQTRDGSRARSWVRSVAAAVAVVLGAPGSLAAAPRSRSVPARKQVDASGVDAAIAVAEGHYNAGRYLQAARAFEALETRGAQVLYYAGLAYEALEHDAKAILVWTKVVGAFEVREELRAEARARLDAARARTTRLRLTVDPPAAAEGALVELEYQSAGARDKLVLSTDEVRQGVYLESGLWTLRVRSPSERHGEVSADIALTPAEGERRMTLALPELRQKVTLHFSPPAAGLRVTLSDPEGPGASEAVEVEGGRHTLTLRRGPWKLRASARGYAPVERALEVGDRDLVLPIRLTALQRPANLRPLAIGAGVTSALLGAGGALGLALSEVKIDRSERGDGRVMVEAIAPATDGILISSLVGGAAAGWLTTTAIAASHRSKTRRIAWLTLALVSPVVVTGGTVWAATWLPVWRREHLTPYNDGSKDQRLLTTAEVRLYRANIYPSMILAGLGASLLLGALTGLVLERTRSSGQRARSLELHGVFPLTLRFR